MNPPYESMEIETADVPSVLEAFDEASLELLDARALLRRVDRKYLMSRHVLDDFLARLRGDYQAVRTAGRPAARYHTRYFDTPDRQMFQDHRRGRLPRYKVRVRHHVDRRMSFLEIKCKKGDGRTLKSVLNRPFGVEELDREALDFIARHCPVDGARLVPRASVEFHRATLVGEGTDERVTIDLNLEMFDEGRRESLPHLVIVEIKQGRFSSQTPAILALRALRVRERSVSKYCLATARLAPVRANSFKPTMLAVERLSA